MSSEIVGKGEVAKMWAAKRAAEAERVAREEMMDYNEKWGGTTSRAMNWDDLVQKNIDAEAEIEALKLSLEMNRDHLVQKNIDAEAEIETLKLSLADRVEEVKSLKAEIGRYKTAIATAMLNLRGQSLKFLGLNLNLNSENVDEHGLRH